MTVGLHYSWFYAANNTIKIHVGPTVKLKKNEKNNINRIK